MEKLLHELFHVKLKLTKTIVHYIGYKQFHYVKSKQLKVLSINLSLIR